MTRILMATQMVTQITQCDGYEEGADGDGDGDGVGVGEGECSSTATTKVIVMRFKFIIFFAIPASKIIINLFLKTAFINPNIYNV